MSMCTRWLFWAAIASAAMVGCGGGGTGAIDDLGESDAVAADRTASDVPLAATDDLVAIDGGKPATDATADIVRDAEGGARCRDNTDCSANELGQRVCDTSSGSCVACTASNRGACVQGQYCTPANRCEAGCATSADCSADGGTLQCHPTTHACVACAADAHCPAGSLCGMNGECVPGCNDAHACPAGEACCGGSCRRTQTDVMNCGTCATVCAGRPNASPACTTGACTTPCAMGFADCDGNTTNGCESALSGTTNCGACGASCAGATPVCVATPTGGFACGSGCDTGQVRCPGGPCVDTRTDPSHCGACGRACGFGPNAAATCTAGVCGLTCSAGFADCDGSPANGCEADVRTSLAHCGACMQACSGAGNQSAACTAGVCVRSCSAGFADCDGNAANGCEAGLTAAASCGACGTVCTAATPVCGTTAGLPACTSGCPASQVRCGNNACADTVTDPRNCGACGTVCSAAANQTARCSASRCVVACSPGFADCDGSAANGCEVDGRSTAAHCGRCGNACPSGANSASRCGAGVCSLVCTAGFGDCDANPANGCEANTSSDPTHCGGCTACRSGEICNSSQCTQVRLNALHNAVTSTAESIVLEGNFASTATVNFPGVASSRATLLGANRAQAVVPVEATAGSLTVTSGGVTTRGLPFRRVTFTPGILTSRLSFEQVGYARQAPRLVNPRDGAVSALIGPALYVMGGDNGGSRSTIERATVNADGSLGAFSAAPGLRLAAARWLPSAVVLADSVVVTGGFDGRALASVERAAINADGTVGAFAAASGVTLTTARFSHTSVVVGNAVYVLGGATAMGVATDTVERAVIQGDGSLGPFTPVGRLVTGRFGATSAVLGGSVYVLGGASRAGGFLTSVERAPINADGTLGAFSTVVGVTLATARAGHTSAVLGNVLVVLGGENAGGNLNSIERATLGVGGALGAFATATGATLATARNNHVSEVVGNFVYSIGGDGASLLASVERASFNGSGSLGAIGTVTGVTLSAPRSGMGLAVIGPAVYLFGGHDRGTYLRTIDRALVSPDGTIGPFAPVAGTLTVARAGVASAVIGNSVYLVGGNNASGYQPSVERATIAADGTLGPFAVVAGLTLQVAQTYTANAVIGNFMYLFGGDGPITSTNHLDVVQRATIAADGTLGSFSQVGTLTGIRSYTTGAVLGSAMWILGGHNNAHQPMSGTERAAINVDATLGAFTTSSAPSLAVAMDSVRCGVIGGFVYLVSGSTSAVQRAAVNPDGSVGAFSTFGPGGSSRSYPSTITLGNYHYILGGATSVEVNSVDRATLQ